MNNPPRKTTTHILSMSYPFDFRLVTFSLSLPLPSTAKVIYGQVFFLHAMDKFTSLP